VYFRSYYFDRPHSNSHKLFIELQILRDLFTIMIWAKALFIGFSFLCKILLQLCIKKRDVKLVQHLRVFFVYYGECLATPLPFIDRQMINPFINSMISTNHEKGLEWNFIQLWNPFTPCSLFSVHRISFIRIIGDEGL
jgi:hypothetical protein